MAFPTGIQQQTSRREEVSSFLPAALPLQRRGFPEGSELGELLEETFELYNPTAAPVTCFLLPGGCAHLLLDLQYGAILCGAMNTIRALTIEAGHTVYAVRFRCGCTSWFGSLPPTCNDVSVPEGDLSWIIALGQILADCANFSQRNAALCRVLAARGGRSYQRQALLRQCLQLIDLHRGQIRVAALAQAAGCSERYLNRLFRSHVGLSTKTYCQLIQLRSSLHILLTTQPKSLLHVAVACGYFDQAHMNRHYHQFLCCAANDIRRGTGPDLPATPLNWPANLILQEETV